MVAHKRTEAGRVRSVFRSDPAAEKQIGRENDRCVLACLGVTHLPFFTQFTQPSASVYTGLGMPAMLPIMIISFIQTGFFEEFLFRGLLVSGWSANSEISAFFFRQFCSAVCTYFWPGTSPCFQGRSSLRRQRPAAFCWGIWLKNHSRARSFPARLCTVWAISSSI